MFFGGEGMQVIESEEGGEGRHSKVVAVFVSSQPVVKIQPATCTTFLGRRKPLQGCTKAQY